MKLEIEDVIADMSEKAEPFGNMDHLATALAPGRCGIGRGERPGFASGTPF
jgi:hypothetical protein